MSDFQSFGICRLCLVSVRSEPKEQSPLLSQLLFGEHYSVVEITSDGQWLSIVQHADGTRGWIKSNQHFDISEAYYQQISTSDYKVCLDTVATILFRKNNITILLGSIVPISTTEIFKMEEQLAFDGEAKSLSQKRDADFFISMVKKYTGTPLLEGGKSPMGIDDGGLLQQTLKMCGYRVKRNIVDIERQGELVTEIAQLVPGDIIFTEKNKELKVSIFFGGDDFFTLEGYGMKQKSSIKEIPSIKSIRRYLKI